MPATSRRAFLMVAGGTCSLGAAAWLWRGRGGPAARPPSSLPRLQEQSPPAAEMQAASRTSWALGSNVSMTAMHSRRDVAETALGAAFDALEQVEALMSIYRPQSQLCRLNRGGVIDDPHPWLVDVLRRAGAMSRRSGGAFDCTVQPLWEVCAQARRDGRRPDQSEIDAAREKIDWRRVEISPRRIQLRGAGTQVTLNGIAQGYATDRAMAALRTHGVSHALVDAGEIGTLGERSPRRPWTVGIQHPRRPEAYVSLAKLAGRCLATSGDYATSFSDDHRDNHLFDPRTGRSPAELASVSVAAATASEADALSTAVFVLGPRRGLELIRSTSSSDALFVTKDGRTMMTEGFPVLTL